MDLLEPSDRGENLTDEERTEAISLLTETILQNPVFIGKKEQVIYLFIYY